MDIQPASVTKKTPINWMLTYIVNFDLYSQSNYATSDWNHGAECSILTCYNLIQLLLLLW